MKKEKVLVGLSGGVDSAVAAHFLLQQGYEVIAGFMKNYAEPENPNCHTREDRNTAIKVANYLGIDTFIIFDFRKEYEQRIINYIYNEYQKGITPNPDVLCNSLIKFDLFLEKAKSLGCQYVGTGHYARVEKDKDGYHNLLKGLDSTKDQSYFLSQLNQPQLKSCLFPLGNYTKKEIRKIAKEIGLPNFDRPDSQGLCFIGNVPIKKFLEKKIKSQKGNVIDKNGNIVGEHDGAYYYTIGQRHGFRTNFRGYIYDINIHKNEISVTKDKEDPKLYSDTIQVSNRHRLGKKPKLPYPCKVKIRYRQKETQTAMIDTNNNTTIIKTKYPQWAVTPGQFVVAYEKDKVIGSGVIKESLLAN